MGFFNYIAMLALLVAYVGVYAAKKDDRVCEVCIKFTDRVIAKAETDGIERTDEAKMEKLIKKMCADAVGKEEKFCFYIGASKTSSTYIVREMTKPIARFLPSDRVCQALQAKDSQICELKYDKPIDWKTVELSKLRVKELKKILEGWGEQCRGCTEKTEFIQRIEELKPLHVKEEL